MHSTQLRLLKIAKELEAACTCEGEGHSEGGCTCEGECTCGKKASQEPVAKTASTDATEAVWQDPNQFDLSENGPPYLRAKLASTDRDNIAKEAAMQTKLAKELLNRIASWDSVEMPYKPLVHLLVVYKAVAHIHQTHHWLTCGPQYYGDHLLYARLYEETSGLVDGIAERAVGLNGPIFDTVDLAQRVGMVVKFLHQHGSGPAEGVEGMAECSRAITLAAIQAIRVVIEHLEEKGMMTAGLDDLLPAHAGTFESHAYLTRQRTA